MKPRPASKTTPLVELAWSHFGVRHRVTTWPEARFERKTEDDWIAESPEEEIYASAAVALDEPLWRHYLEFVPLPERMFLTQFKYGRLAAFQVLVHCPELLPILTETLALTSFIASHASLRGLEEPRWEEVSAVFERSGVYGLLEWLGLPASRQTLAILRNIADPDVPRRLLEPLRAMLWDPAAIFELQRIGSISERKLAHCCHSLAA